MEIQPPRKPDLSRLTQPVPWRPALLISDACYPLPKPVVRLLIESAQGVARR